MKVLKFGGTSLGDASRMRQVADILESEPDCMVVCSAMAGVTNTLTDVARLWRLGNSDRSEYLLLELHAMFSKTCYDLFPDFGMASQATDAVNHRFREVIEVNRMPHSTSGEFWLLAQGEIITSTIFANYLNSRGMGFKLLDAMKLIQIQEDGEPSVPDIQTKIYHLHGQIQVGRYVTQGFICVDHNGEPSNLTRGGSDYTATLLGAALHAEFIEIWTDIDGVRNNDPRFVDNTYAVRELSFSEAAELAYFGAKILHPSCVWPASSVNIPIHLRNTMKPDAPGTIIRKFVTSAGVRAVAAKDGITIVRIKSARMLNAYGFLRRIFEIFEAYRTPIDVITTSEVAVSLTIDNPAYLEKISGELRLLGDVSVEPDQSIVCIVGDILAEHQGYAALILDALKHFHVKMVSYGGSRNNLTVVIPAKEKPDALVALQKYLFNGKDRHEILTGLLPENEMI